MRYEQNLRSKDARSPSYTLQVAVHAIGDRAVDNLVDIYSEVAKVNGERDRRFRMEHVQVVCAPFLVQGSPTVQQSSSPCLLSLSCPVFSLS